MLDVVRSTTSSPRLLGGAPPQTDEAGTAGLLRFSWLQNAGSPGVDPPDDARLLSALEEAIPKASTVGDLERAVSKKYLQLEKAYPNLTYDRFLPEQLIGLIVGRP